MATNADLIVVGGGLAGCEAAWQAARRGLRVALYEMRPLKSTQAHTSGQLAEIVCSNSFGSDQRNKPAGLLKAELRHLNSFILRCAEDARLPAGGALAVDREVFSRTVTERLGNIPGVEIVRQEVTQIPQSPCIIASGPLTSPGLSDAIAQLLGHQFLFFYDAIAPIVEFDSIDMTKVFWASRYDNHEDSPGDYLNCPMTEKEYTRFITELINAKKVALRSFDAPADPAAAGKTKGYF
jgi:methylenetetrahydrofolate--tRNA-(uracil-5-)-methyltransferase